jgi:type IV pilus biogenesis protein CpaD/CtpE
MLLLGSLAGCAATDTYSRPGTWHPDAANAANIAAMAANPEDLLHGRGSHGSDATLAVGAIERVWNAAQPNPADPGGGTGGGTGGATSGAAASGGASRFATPVLPTAGGSGGT